MSSKPYHFVLLRGLIRDQRHWFKFKDLLAEAFPQSLIRCIDFPGVGINYPLTSPATVEGIKGFCRAQILPELAQTSQTHHPILISISLGAMVGLRWCQDHPEDFKNAFFINTSAKNLGALKDRFNLKLLPNILKAFIHFKPEVSESIILNATTNLLSESAKSATLKTLIEWQKSKPASRQTFMRQIAAGARFKYHGPIKTHSTVIVSLKDRLVSPQCSIKLAHLLNTTPLKHPTAGHDLSTDDPSWLLNTITETLRTSS
jgi:pimeloyl-ACP methyl ester carboxylesterase